MSEEAFATLAHADPQKPIDKASHKTSSWALLEGHLLPWQGARKLPINLHGALPRLSELFSQGTRKGTNLSGQTEPIFADFR